MSTVRSPLGVRAPFGAEYGYRSRWNCLGRWLIRSWGVLDLPTRQRARLILPYLQSAKPARVLDIGCGVGHWSFWLARQNWVERVLGVDPITERMDDNRRVAAALGLNKLEFLTGHFPQVGPAPGDRFDAVLGIESLHCILDIEAAFRSIREILLPNGSLFVHVPVLGYLRSWEQHNLDSDRLRELCANAGLSVIELSRTFGGFQRSLHRTNAFLLRKSRLLSASAFPLLLGLSQFGRLKHPAGEYRFLVASRSI